MKLIRRVTAIFALSLCIATFPTLSNAGVSEAETQFTAGVPCTALPKQMDDAVERYRKIIVLTEGEAALDAGTRERVSVLGRILFEQNSERLAEMSSSAANSMLARRTPCTESFLSRVESSPEYRDADKLVFRDILEDLSAKSSEFPAGLRKRIVEDNDALNQIQAIYEKEVARTFGQFETRAMPVRREAWERYVEYIRTKYQRDAILREYEAMLPPVEGRGAGRPKKRDEIFGNELPPKTVLLTFDDGPHPRYTDQVLELLKKHNIQAVFFEVGKNVGSIAKDGTVKLTPASAASTHVVEAGSAIGNHSYTHALLPKLDEAGYKAEIDSTNKVLKVVQKTDLSVFRPPYGASNDNIQTLITSEHLKSMIWNVDSLDWSDPVPASIAERVLTQVKKSGRGIILFHDIHKRSLEALPTILDALEADGYKFASWTPNGITTNGGRGLETSASLPVVEAPYRESWAAIIGIDGYKSWPKLRYAANDAQGVRDVLIEKYKFKPDHVFTLTNEQATRQNILSLLGDKLADPEMVKRDDRVVVFFAGHGATRKLPSGRELGYIVPVDADLSNYQGQAISMTNFQDVAEAIPAKHLLFIMDSCYSGLALTRGASASGGQNYLREIAHREARQMFTAGGADQQVADNGPNGHSVFTWTLLQALDGRGDLNGDGVITASELATYVAPAVSALSHQTPAFGNLVGSEGGDFIFELKHESEFLDANSTQLGDDAIRVNSELERLRAENLAKTQENEKLRAQLAAIQTESAHAKPALSRSPAAPGRQSAFALNDDGMRLYKERKYEEALEKFKAAAGMDAKSALFANNAGFVLYKLERFEEAAQWFEKAIELDPNRAVAYLNAGDAYARLNRAADAKRQYERYLALAPTSKSAPEVTEKLKALGQ